jgi:hypothetical protein
LGNSGRRQLQEDQHEQEVVKTWFYFIDNKKEKKLSGDGKNVAHMASDQTRHSDEQKWEYEKKLYKITVTMLMADPVSKMSTYLYYSE